MCDKLESERTGVRKNHPKPVWDSSGLTCTKGMGQRSNLHASVNELENTAWGFQAHRTLWSLPYFPDSCSYSLGT